jgi:hypothetical protein
MFVVNVVRAKVTVGGGGAVCRGVSEHGDLG